MLRELIKKYNPVNYLNLKFKLIITYTFILFIIIFTLQKVSYYYASSVITKNSMKYSQLVVDKISSEIDMTIDELDRLTQTILSDDTVIRDISLRGFNSNSESAEYKNVKAFMTGILNFRRDIDSITISNNEGNFLISGPNSYIPPGYNIKNNVWYDEFYHSEDMFEVVPPQFNITNLYEVFSAVRKIRTFSDGAVKGIIKIDRRITVLDEICKKGELEENSIVIFDKNKKPVYNTGINLTPDEIQTISQSISGYKGSIQLHSSGDVHIINYVTSNYTGLTTAFIVPEKVLLKDLKVINNTSIILTIFFCILALVFSIVNSYAMTLSVKTLLKGMKRIEHGDFDTKVEIRSHDEISILARGFNTMVEKIKVLIRQNADMEVKKKEAEMMVLQGQINPHFLYNTLDGIRMKAVIKQDDDTAYMIEELSQLLRTTANVKKEFVTLRDEINYIHRYINLQNIRYKHKFQLTIQIPEQLLDMTVPKFIIQPIIENTVYHGLEVKKNDRKIYIEGTIDNQMSIIKISDNGIGMREEELMALRESLQMRDDESGGKIGLRNIHSRLKLYYGEQYGIHIDSTFEVGTTVYLRFPLPEQGAFDNDNLNAT